MLMRFDGFEELLRYWAEASPKKPALLDSGTALSYSELCDSVMRRAEELRNGGKSCTGILCNGSLPCVVEIFAANLAGLQIVLLDENSPVSLLRGLIAYTDIDTLWGDPDLCEELVGCLTGGVKEGAGKILFFTSGTTERSKAVVLTDHSLCQSAWNGSAKLPLSEDDRLLCMLPLGHVFGFVCGLLWGLSCGATVALGRGPRHYLDDCAYYQPTALSVVPRMLGFLLQQDALNDELRLLLVGAGDCPPQLLQAVGSKGIRVSFGYGLTETSSGVAISVGGDPYAMEVCPDDIITIAEDGEILIAAPTCMMQGYYKWPQYTEEVLRHGILSTGDLGHFDADGRLHVTGRKKDMLVLGDGTKIFLPEYEAGVMKALGYTELAVILQDDRPVLVYSGQADRNELLEKLRPLMRHLPRGQQLRDILIVEDALPRTASGKIKRWELQQKVGHKT
ncbi:MAG: acyl--CoA ligase [Oscillospiraceae bacterium]|nr:acyl--CoA ligase [Oscillospiraceae bacterium]